MSRKLNELNKELENILIDFDENNRETIKEKITEFDKNCIKLTKKVLPNFRIPIYMSIHNFDGNKPNSKILWEDWDNIKNKYKGLSDNYCRDAYGNGNYVYPVINPNTDVIYFRNCDTYIDQELKDISNIKNELSLLIGEARNTILRADLSSGTNRKQIQKQINNKLKEYESLQEKYIQVSKLLDNFNLLLKDKSSSIEKKEGQFDKLDNDLNIKRDIENTFNKQFNSLDNRNSKLLKYAKILLFICWLLVLGLFSLININRVII
jgi:hypothetical protein